MAQKAAKTLAANNAKRLNITLYATIAIHGFYWLLRLLFSRRSQMSSGIWRYMLLSAPSLIIQFWFESISRPKFGSNGEVQRAGEDLDAKGLTEWMWDVLYWTYGCLILVSLFGDRLWWAYTVIPLYSVYLAYTTLTGARQTMAGLTGAGADAGASTGQGQSKRQQKLEKRGGVRVQYR